MNSVDIKLNTTIASNQMNLLSRYLLFQKQEQNRKSVESYQERHQDGVNNIVLILLYLIFNRFNILLWLLQFLMLNE